MSRAQVPMSRAQFEERLFGVLRWVVIAFLALITLVPFYYMLLLSVKPIDALLLDPGRLWVARQGVHPRARTRKCSSRRPRAARASCDMLTNSAIASVGAVVLTLLAAIPGSYAVSRLRFFGGRQVSALFLAVYLFPATLLAVPLFVMFARMGLAGQPGRARHRLHRADRAGLDLHDEELLRHHPASASRRPPHSTAARGCRPSARSCCRSPRPR